MSSVPPTPPFGAGEYPVPRLSADTKNAPDGLDRVCPPEETRRIVAARLASMAAQGKPLCADTQRVDIERLGIPVHVCQIDEEANRIMPRGTRMGQGTSVEQAEVSAQMRLVEEYSFYAFWERLPRLDGVFRGTWSDAQRVLGPSLIAMEDILRSVGEQANPARLDLAVRLFDLLPWTFVPTLHLGEGRTVWLPVEWFRMINAFNGCSAGNTVTESIHHGLCELVERHVCAVISRERLECPTIDPQSVIDPTARALLKRFADEGVDVLIKDFSLDMPVPTVGVLAVDPSTFPLQSELVFTAATASSPAGALIRALTEAARLGGDFCTKSWYEPVGLPKFGNRIETRWLESPARVPLAALANVSGPNLSQQLGDLVAALRGKDIQAYSLDMTHPDLGLPAHMTIAPALDFLQRDAQEGIGLFIGRRLAEEAPLDTARRGIDMLGRLLPENSFLHLFRGILALRAGDAKGAGEQFTLAGSMQNPPEREALVAYYGAYSHVLREDWGGALPWLDRAIALSPASSESWSLRGICRFKLHDYAAAAENFKAALRRNKGSAPDLANLGACLMALDENDQARACLATALSMDPGLTSAQERLDHLTAQDNR